LRRWLSLLELRPGSGAEQDRGELVAEKRHPRVLEVCLAVEDELRKVGDDAGPIAPDRRHDEPLPHAHSPVFESNSIVRYAASGDAHRRLGPQNGALLRIAHRSLASA
jgi:hypothetical protein